MITNHPFLLALLAVFHRTRARGLSLPRTLFSWRVLMAVAIVVLTLLSACLSSQDSTPAAQGGGDNLLAGLTPTRQQGIRRAQRLTDGVIALVGDHWNTNLSATFNSTQAFVEWDLGTSKPIQAGYLQGDNNDTYIISASEDGTTFRTVWEAGPAAGGGMQARSKDELRGTGRYVRVSGREGDGLYALTEVQLFSAKPAVFPPKLTAQDGSPLEEMMRTKMLVFGLALSAAVLLSWKGSRTWWTLTLLGLALLAGWDVARTLVEHGPAAQQDVALMRGVVAAVACVAVLREALAPKNYLADSKVVLGVLGVCGVLSFASFYNLGHLQFFDRKDGTPSFVHTFDMRVYYPVAKYWKELGYDGVYLASVAAAVEDEPTITYESVTKNPVRSLKTHRTQTIGEVRGDIEQVKARFTPERWAAFKVDMRYFRLTMGQRDYFSTLTDHGANATPVWMAIAHGLFAWTHASDRVLVLGGLLDPLLLFVAFGFVWWAFGLRTMLLSMVVFGATDYYMFGSNWAGATLRHDWMAYLGIGICLLARKKWEAGGALLVMSALIRAFPALALAGVFIPGIWWMMQYRKENNKLPSWDVIKREQHPLVRVAFGALVCGAVAFAVSVAVCSFESWPAWYKKVFLLDTGAAVNQVSLRGLLGGTDAYYTRILRSRAVLQWSGIVVYVALVFFAARKRQLYQAAVLGMMAVPVVFNPANYYAHFIYVIPLLGVSVATLGIKDLGKPARGVKAGVWIAVLLLCAMEYMTVTDKDVGHHFVVGSSFLMVALTAILLMVVAKDYQLGAEVSAGLAAASPLPTPQPSRPKSGRKTKAKGAEAPTAAESEASKESESGKAVKSADSEQEGEKAPKEAAKQTSEAEATEPSQAEDK